MGMWDTIKMAFWATGWILTNPIKAALCVVALFLLIKGIMHTIKILTRPSTYGLGRANQGNGGSSGGRSPSIFTMVASAILIIAISCMGYLTVELHQNYSMLSDSFERIAQELNRLTDIVELRGKDFHRGLITLNDSILESYVNLFGRKSSDASDGYAFQIEAALRATQDLDHKAQRFAPLLRQLRHSHALLRADQRHYSTMFPHPMVDENFEELSLLIFFEEMDGRLQVIIEDLERGSTSLQRYLRRAKEYQPSPEMEARDIKQVIEKDILDAFTKSGTIKIINIFNLSEFEVAIQKIRRLTAGKARGTSLKLRYLAYHGIIAALAASTAAIFALFMNRLQWPRVGLLYPDHTWYCITLYRSLIGFTLLFGMELARDQYFGGLANSIEQFCSKSIKHDNMVVAQLFDLPIKKDTIARFLQGCGEGRSLPSAFHAAFGPKQILKGTIQADKDGMTIRFKKNGLLFVPQRLEDIKRTFVEAHGRVIDELSENGQELKDLIKDYKKVAESCSSEALLKFPNSWRAAMVRIPKVLGWLDAMTRRLEGFRRMEGTDMLAKHSREFTVLLNSVKGLTKTAMHISDRLMDACKAQKEAIRGLEGKSAAPDPSQQIRLAALGSKAHTLMTPIFDAGFVIKPAERCVKEACGRVRGNLERVKRSNKHMVLALGVGTVAVIFVVGVPGLLMRGALFMVPCLEIGDYVA